MKILKSVRPIFGMSYTRSKAIEQIKGLSDPIERHLIKCIVYGDTTNDLYHWVHDEIAQYLHSIHTICVKPNNKKLKRTQYEDLIFGSFGNTRNDVKTSLLIFRAWNNRTKQYPEFEVDEDMVDRLFKTVTNMKEKVIPILITTANLDRENFYNLIKDIIVTI